MRVALTVADFLDRAALVYGHRAAVVDEPGRAGLARARLTYAELAARARGMALALDDLGVEPRGAGGHREPELGAVPDLLLRGQRLRPHPRADQLPAHRATRSPTSSSTPGRPSSCTTRIWPTRWTPSRWPTGSAWTAPTTPRLFAPAPDGCRARGVGGRRGRHLLGQLHVGHDGAAQGRAADAPQLLAQRGDVRVAHRRQRPRRAAAHAADVPLQRLGDALRRDRHGRHARRAAQGGRRGDPVADRAARGHAAVRRARRGGGHPRARPRRGGGRGATVPGRGTVRIVVAGAPPPSKTIERIETELGWEFIQIYGLTETAPLLTINRAPAEWDDARARPSARSC